MGAGRGEGFCWGPGRVWGSRYKGGGGVWGLGEGSLGCGWKAEEDSRGRRSRT